MSTDITKEAFAPLVSSPRFVLPFYEALDGFICVGSVKPYGPALLGDVLDEGDGQAANMSMIDYTSTTEASAGGLVAGIIAGNEHAMRENNRELWKALLKCASEGEWVAIWAKNKHRNNVATAIQQLQGQ